MTVQLGVIRAAVVQAAPIAFDRERTLAKVRALTRDAASKGAKLVVFPEAFVSAYPRGLSFGAVVGGSLTRRTRGVPALLGKRRGYSRPGHGGTDAECSAESRVPGDRRD
jgi:hypothetical protein